MLTFISYSSLAIGINAGLLAFFYSYLTDSLVVPRIILVGLATFASYNITQLAPLRKKPPVSERNRWIYGRRKLLWSLTAVALALVAFLAFQLSLYDVINFAHLFLLSLFYEDTFGNTPLRKVPHLKPFFITYIWTMSCAFPPIYDHFDNANLWMLPECFLFIFALCVLFDMRDEKEDRELGVVTIPSQFGAKTTKLVAAVTFLAAMAILAFFAGIKIWAIVLFFGLFAGFLFRLNEDSGEFSFLYGVDGFIGLKCALLLAIWPQ